MATSGQSTRHTLEPSRVAVGRLGIRTQLSLPAGLSPGGGASRSRRYRARQRTPSAGWRPARGGRRYHDIERRQQRSVEVALRQAAQGDQRRLVAADAGAGRPVAISIARRAPNRKASMAMAKSGSASRRPATLKPRCRIEPSDGKARSCCHWRRAHSTKRSPIGNPDAQPRRPQPRSRSVCSGLSVCFDELSMASSVFDTAGIVCN